MHMDKHTNQQLLQGTFSFKKGQITPIELELDGSYLRKI